MTGSEHSKKPKMVTIDLEPNAAQEQEHEQETVLVEATPDQTHDIPDEPVAEPVGEAISMPLAAKPSSGLIGKIGAGVLGGFIALSGGAGLQYGGLLPSFDNQAELQTLKTDVAKLLAAPVADFAPIEDLKRAQDAVVAEVSALNGAMAQLKAAPSSGDGLTALRDKVAALETAIAGLPIGGAASDPMSSPAFKALSDKVAALGAAPTSDTKSVAMAIAASGLKAAIDRGGSFMSELETYASVAPASPDIDALRLLAAKGVPPSQALLAGFGDAANAMIAASVVPNPNMGILERLTTSALGLVKSRRVGDIVGNEPDAILARMEVALQRGDLDAVLKLSVDLPAASKTAGQEFLASVTARRDTDTLVTRALGAALTAAGGKS